MLHHNIGLILFKAIVDQRQNVWMPKLNQRSCFDKKWLALTLLNQLHMLPYTNGHRLFCSILKRSSYIAAGCAIIGKSRDHPIASYLLVSAIHAHVLP